MGMSLSITIALVSSLAGSALVAPTVLRAFPSDVEPDREAGAHRTGPEPDGRGSTLLAATADTGVTAGVAEVQTVRGAEGTADFVARMLGHPAAPVADRLLRLRSLHRPGIYLHMHRTRTPARVVLEPSSGDRAVMVLRAELSATLSGDSGERVAVFWVNGGKQAEYRIQVPHSANHFTLVVNGREVTFARPVRLEGGPVVINAN